MIPLVQILLTRFTYVALALLLIGAGCGVPIPEDIPLIFSGYLCNPHQSPLSNLTPASTTAGHSTVATSGHVPNAEIMVLFGLMGMLGGDSILYFVGRHGIDTNNILARHIRKVMHSRRRERVEKYFRKHGNLTLFFGRFVPGVRAVIFALCGMSRMPYWRFLAVDCLAGILFIPTMITLGYWQAAHINWLFEEVARVKHYLYIVIGIGALIALVVFFLHRRQTMASKNPRE